MTMLIVVESAKVREMLKHVFRDTADTIYECSDGRDALASFAAHRPDWVVMDVKMPNLDGVAATQLIIDRYPDAQIIILTQYDDRLMRQQALAAGALDYVLKENMYMLPDIMKQSHLGEKKH